MKREVRPLLLLALVLLTVPASATGADENIRLQCAPRAIQVVPGEPIRLELTIQSPAALPFRLHVPDVPLLKLRAQEKLPVRRTRKGVVTYQRVLVWQGLEPGTVKLKDLWIKTREQKLSFPVITITVRDPHP
jgi:hypothetical protein